MTWALIRIAVAVVTVCWAVAFIASILNGSAMSGGV